MKWMAQLVGACGVGAVFVTQGVWITSELGYLVVPWFLGCLGIYWWGRQP